MHTPRNKLSKYGGIFKKYNNKINLNKARKPYTTKGANCPRALPHSAIFGRRCLPSMQLRPISGGGTGATTASTALSNLGAVPTSRTVNGQPLSANISLTATDVGAATSTQGTKAESAIQGVKVNGTLLSPDANKAVNIDATSINAATPEQGAKADSAIQGIQGNGTTIAPNASKIVNVTPANIGAVPTSRTINSKALSGNISLTASDVGAASSSHNHSASNITSGTLPVSRGGTGVTTLTSGNILLGNGTSAIISTATLPISKGGTGATTASAALSNLGITISSGTWTPTLASRSGTNPTYTVYYRYARYYRINNLVYITFHLKVNITNAGTDYACIRGLPFATTNNMDGQGLALRECFGGLDHNPGSAFIPDSSSIIYLQTVGGEGSQQWRTGDTWIGFSGCYIKA